MLPWLTHSVLFLCRTCRSVLQSKFVIFLNSYSTLCKLSQSVCLSVCHTRLTIKVKGKGRYSSSWEPHLRATGRHLPYGITQCYLPSVRAPPNPSHASRYSIYLPRRDGRLSWPSWLDSAPAGSRTRDLSIRSPTPPKQSSLSLIVLSHPRSIIAAIISPMLRHWSG